MIRRPTPSEVRALLRREAGARGVSVDELVTDARGRLERAIVELGAGCPW